MNKYQICIKGSSLGCVWIYVSGDALKLNTIHGDDCLPDPTVTELTANGKITIEYETHDVTVTKERTIL